ncbi:RND transporter [Advenella faeciporci]|uniref:RND transporter n=2 Tax=Advenella faeciporci TaxID=797535 RepID=A0A918JNC7_9BURK|nr:RND transporter [Advenella faeciporci]
MLTACAVGPDYDAPPLVATGDGWSQADTVTSAPTDLARWWSTLGDPVLERLIDTALAANLDLRVAAARIDEARALRDRVAGEQLPTAGASTSVNRRRQSENGPLPIGSMPGLETTQTIYDAGFDAAWEADLFGAKQRALEGAGAQLQAVEADAQGVRMRIVAEVARAWFTAAGAGQELHTQQAMLETLEHTLELVRKRQALGDASASDVDTAYAQWAAVHATLPDIQARQRAAVLSLGVLLGAPPEHELALLNTAATPLTLLALPVGERADVLRRRPDVLAAERRLAASMADIGVATAELFPKLSIGIGGGFQALATGDWFNSSSTRFSILPLISWRLFDGGRVRAEIRAREATGQQAALAYEQAVLTALGDAERALSDYHAGLDALGRRQAALKATRRSHDHAKARYAAGDIALVELLAAERVLYEAETANVHAHTTAAVQLVALYKALGGGWEAPATKSDTATPAQGLGVSIPSHAANASAAPRP